MLDRIVGDIDKINNTIILFDLCSLTSRIDRMRHTTWCIDIDTAISKTSIYHTLREKIRTIPAIPYHSIDMEPYVDCFALKRLSPLRAQLFYHIIYSKTPNRCKRKLILATIGDGGRWDERINKQCENQMEDRMSGCASVHHFVFSRRFQV